jgi:hypothetical protein
MVWELLDDDLEPDSSPDILRHGARQLSNIGTRIAGFQGDTMSLVNSLLKPVAEKAIGKDLPNYEDSLIGSIKPTTESYRKNLNRSSGGYLKPQNEIERWSDDVVEDTISLFVPGGSAKVGSTLLGRGFKNLAKSIGVNLAGESAKQISNSEGAGSATKIGALFLTSLIDQESAAKQISKLYKNAEANLPKGSSVSAVNLNKSLSQLKKNVTKGRPSGNLAASEKFVVDAIEKVEKLGSRGKISVEQAIAQKRSLNEELQKLYQVAPSKKDQLRTRQLAKQINGHLNEVIEDYGKTNPSFLKPYKEANEAFGTMARSKFMTQWAEKNIAKTPVTHGLMHIILGPAGISAATAAGGAIVPYQAARLTYRIAKSPALSKIYGNMIKSAVKEDSVNFNKYLKELDSNLQEEENKEFWEFLD